MAGATIICCVLSWIVKRIRIGCNKIFQRRRNEAKSSELIVKWVQLLFITLCSLICILDWFFLFLRNSTSLLYTRNMIIHCAWSTNEYKGVKLNAFGSIPSGSTFAQHRAEIPSSTYSLKTTNSWTNARSSNAKENKRAREDRLRLWFVRSNISFRETWYSTWNNNFPVHQKRKDKVRRVLNHQSDKTISWSLTGLWVKRYIWRLRNCFK